MQSKMAAVVVFTHPKARPVPKHWQFSSASLFLLLQMIHFKPVCNGWVVESWAEEMEKAYYADPKVVASERPGQWSPRVESRGETYAEVGEDSTKVHLARFFESVRTRKPPVEDGERGHRAAAAAHLVNESVRSQKPVLWDAAAGAIKKG